MGVVIDPALVCIWSEGLSGSIITKTATKSNKSLLYKSSLLGSFRNKDRFCILSLGRTDFQVAVVRVRSLLRVKARVQCRDEYYQICGRLQSVASLVGLGGCGFKVRLVDMTRLTPSILLPLSLSLSDGAVDRRSNQSDTPLMSSATKGVGRFGECTFFL